MYSDIAEMFHFAAILKATKAENERDVKRLSVWKKRIEKMLTRNLLMNVYIFICTWDENETTDLMKSDLFPFLMRTFIKLFARK